MNSPKPMFEQLELLNVDTPCIGVCEVNNRGYCKGCFRNRDERRLWQQFSNEQKGQVLSDCKRRKKRVLAKKRKQVKEQQFAEAKERIKAASDDFFEE